MPPAFKIAILALPLDFGGKDLVKSVLVQPPPRDRQGGAIERAGRKEFSNGLSVGLADPRKRWGNLLIGKRSYRSSVTEREGGRGALPNSSGSVPREAPSFLTIRSLRSDVQAF